MESQEVPVKPKEEIVTTGARSSQVLIENSCSFDMLIILVENIIDRKVDSDFYVEMIPDLRSAVITFNSETDSLEFIGKFSSYHRVKQYNLRGKFLEETRMIRAEGFSPNMSEEMITLYFESGRSGGGPIEKVDMIPDEGAALITFTSGETVKSVLTKQHEISKKAISVYPYYPSIGECLYGKKRPVVELPDPVDFPINPHLLEFFSKNAKLKKDTEDHLADHHCEVKWPALDCQKPAVTLSIPSKLSAQYRKMLKITPTWSKKVHSQLSHLMSKYKITECDVKSSVWEVIKDKVSGQAYNSILCRPDMDAEKVFLVGLSEDVIKIESSFRDMVDKVTRELTRVEDDVSLEPHFYKFLERSPQKDFSNLQMNYDSSTRKVKLCGSDQEVLNAKCNILSAVQDLKSRAVHLDPQIIQFLVRVDNEELSSDLFIRNHINAILQVRENDVLLTGSSEKDIAEAEKQIKKELVCRRMSVEDRQVIQIPEWDSIKMNMTELLNGEKMTMVMEVIPAGAKDEVSISGLSSAVEIAYQKIHEFLMENTVVQENIAVKSEAVMMFIEENKKEILDAIKDQVSITRKKNTITLSGPKQYVKEGEGIIRSALSRLHSETLYIDKPGAKKFCIENEGLHANNTWTMFKSIVYLQKDGVAEAAAIDMHVKEPHCRVTLPDGVTISVYKDQPYHQKVGAAVVAASDDLKPIGLAQTLLNDEVRDECESFLRKEGKLEPGDSIITDAGNLPCEQLIHAVSSKWDKKSKLRCERSLCKAIKSGLDLAADNGHSSVAISASGFAACGYPVDTCTECIVTSIRKYMEGQQGPSSIRYIHLVDSGDDIIKAFTHSLTDEYGDDNVKFSSKQGTRKMKAEKKYTAANKVNDQMVTTKEGIKIKILQGNIQDATTNVIVNSVGKELNLQSGAVSKAIFMKAGAKLQELLRKENPQTPVADGSVPITDGCNLASDLVIHCVVPQWDEGQGSSEKILRKIVNDCLRATEEKQMQSISFPAMGTGVLRFPKNTVASIMYEEILNFSSKGNNNYLKEVTFMLHPSDVETIKAFSTELEKKTKDPASQKKSDKSQSLLGPVNSPSADVHEIKIGCITYQVKMGDITKEDTDVIVNSANSTFNSKSGVSKKILEEAGKAVEDECAQLEATKPNQRFLITSGGKLSCKNILHINGCHNLVKKDVIDVLTECDRLQAASVAFPALGTGIGKLSADAVASIMLEAVVDYVSSASIKSVKTVKVVIFDPSMLKDFSASLNQKVQKPSLFTWFLHKIGLTGNKTEDEEKEETKAFELRENIEPVIYHLCAETKKAVTDTSSWLRQLILKEQHENVITDDWILELGEKERKSIAELQKTLQVTVNIDLPSTTIKVSGLTKDVLNLTNQIQNMIKNVREKKAKEREAELCSNLVQWKYIDGNKFIPFDQMTNLELENAKNTEMLSLNIIVSGVTYTVVIETKSMRDPKGKEFKIERFPKHENTLDLPTYWNSMDKTQLKVVSVDARSQEYSEVHAQFAKTCQMKVIKIERIQNVHLYQNYQIKKQSINTKNGTTDNEKQLFHGTDVNTVQSVNSNGFNRSYSGLNVGAVLGNGTYFAVDANYSAVDSYSKPDTNGHKYMYLARVLTGIFCVGKKGMIAPPPKNSSDSTDCYNSLTDDLANPKIFVIFNDVQAYPEYLITFSK
ncbi:protein mono-ADP-ribosyltransferase PARP14-like [Dendropsophus ebraccatus]|uniref:protein mono-ADP-ribosyltransferase PARP14-like n=1 Tax=Dendropsophus ebraccatus TaxID=150705 RepID=UPI003831126E